MLNVLVITLFVIFLQARNFLAVGISSVVTRG